MKQSAPIIDALIERYVGSIVKELPKSPNMDVTGEPPRHQSDNRLIRLLGIAAHRNPLRGCSPKRANLLIARVMGRSWMAPKIKSSTGHTVELERQGRRYSMTELGSLAPDLGYQKPLTQRAVKRELAAARKEVHASIKENNTIFETIQEKIERLSAIEHVISELSGFYPGVPESMKFRRRQQLRMEYARLMAELDKLGVYPEDYSSYIWT